MTLDLTKLSAAPWTWHWPERFDDYEGPMASLFDGSGEIVCNFGDSTLYYPTQGSEPSPTDAEFIALARNAFDVMMRRGWEVHHIRVGQWGVPYVMHEGEFRAWLKLDPKALAADPFTALVEADRWYRENIEKS